MPGSRFRNRTISGERFSERYRLCRPLCPKKLLKYNSISELENIRLSLQDHPALLENLMISPIPGRQGTMKTILSIIVALILLPSLARAQYSIDWYTIDGGGGTSSGGSYTLSGTIGQPDAGTMTGGSFSLEGGFWPGIIVPSTGEAPTLFIQLTGTSVIISWAPATSGFALEQADSLSTPSWGPGPAGNPTSPVTASAGTRFYRLRK